jgi:hypothetical protein
MASERNWKLFLRRAQRINIWLADASEVQRSVLRTLTRKPSFRHTRYFFRLRLSHQRLTNYVFSKFIWTLYQWLKNFYYSLTEKPCNRNNVVDIATGYGMDDREVGVRVPVGVKDFLFSTSSRPVLGPTQPSVQWVPGSLSPGVKREADHLPPASAKVKKMWIITSPPPPIRLHGVVLD